MVTYRAIILGEIWQPGYGLCSLEVIYQAEDDDQATEKAYTSEAGDFSSVRDVFILACEECNTHGLLPHTGERLVKDWDNEDNEYVYLDTIQEEGWE